MPLSSRLATRQREIFGHAGACPLLSSRDQFNVSFEALLLATPIRLICDRPVVLADGVAAIRSGGLGSLVPASRGTWCPQALKRRAPQGRSDPECRLRHEPRYGHHQVADGGRQVGGASLDRHRRVTGFVGAHLFQHGPAFVVGTRQAA